MESQSMEKKASLISVTTEAPLLTMDDLVNFLLW